MQYQIGDFAKMTQISHKQLKYYEQCGLLVPAHINKDSGYRYYEAEQLRTVAHIRAFMSMGFTTSEIKTLLANGDYPSAFDLKQKELEATLQETHRQLDLLSFYRDAMQSGDFNQPYRASRKTTLSGLAAVRRGVFANSQALVDEWQDLYDECRCANAVTTSAISGFTRFHDNQFELENFDAELVLFLEKHGDNPLKSEYQHIEPVQAVSVIHRGGYEFLNEAYAFAYMWIDRNRYIANGLPMEDYLCGPFSGKPESDYITELYIPIKAL